MIFVLFLENMMSKPKHGDVEGYKKEIDSLKKLYDLSKYENICNEIQTKIILRINLLNKCISDNITIEEYEENNRKNCTIEKLIKIFFTVIDAAMRIQFSEDKEKTNECLLGLEKMLREKREENE